MGQYIDIPDINPNAYGSHSLTVRQFKIVDMSRELFKVGYMCQSRLLSAHDNI